MVDGAVDRTMFTPGGAQTISKMRWNFPENWPRVLDWARGARVGANFWRGEIGHEWVDWTMGLASVGIGYADPRVRKAIQFELASGPAYPLAYRREGELAERLVDSIPCAEMVRFLKTGSEAAEAAIRTARIATGRDVIVTAGYHSWHSWYAASRPDHPGVPEVMGDLVSTFVYNDLRSLDLAIAAAEPERVAAIFLEPTLVEEPKPGFLEACRERADALRCPLIFDEIVTGFRWAIGGYQTLCGAMPDLAVFGKAMGNGVPISALVGSRALMDHAWAASGTFNGDAIGLAAALRVLDIYELEDVCALMEEAGNKFRHAFAIARLNWPGSGASLLGQPQHPVVRFDDDADRRKMTLFLRVLAENGVLLHPNGFNPSAAHGVGELAQTATALEAALASVAQAVATGRLVELVPTPVGAGWRPTP